MQRPKKCPALPTSPSSTPTSGQCRPYPVQERQPTSLWGTSVSGLLSAALGPSQGCALGLVSLSKVLKTRIPPSKSFKRL